MMKQSKSGNFVHKLDKLLKNQLFSDIITWDSSKTSIDVLDISKMEAEIIPKFFRHQKFQSFVRQLNLYGFRKIKLQGRHRFTHPLLLNGQSLVSITSFKCSKPAKQEKSLVQSLEEASDVSQLAQINPIPINSTGIQQKNETIQNKNIQEATIERRQVIGGGRVGPGTIYVVPSSYFNLWNMMSMMGNQNMGGIINMGQMISYQ